MGLFSSTTALALAAVLSLYVVGGLIHNTYKAKSIGLPYTFTLIHELEGLAYVTDPILRRLCRAHVLRGQGWPRWARFMIKDWHYEDKYRAHNELGPTFLVVSPAGIVCYVADATAALHILTMRKAFVKPPEKMKMLEPFGPNIGSSEGELWRVHSRIATPSFDESTLALVRNETQKQAAHLRKDWLCKGTTAFEKEIYTLTMKIMRTVSFDFDAHSNINDSRNLHKTQSSGHKLSLLEALIGVVMHLPHILLMPKLLLRYSPWNAAYTAYSELDSYMDELLLQASQELERSSETPRRKGNLLHAILRHSQQNGRQEGEESPGKLSLTNQEIKGNLFIFLLAGYDTTANTIIYSCIFLALYPDIQDRILSEIEQFRDQSQRVETPDKSVSRYLANFPYLISFMYEILRVFPVIRPIARQTTSAQQLLGAHHVVLPVGTDIIVNNTALHFSEHNWPSPEIIDPRRWLVRNPNTFNPSLPPSKEQETEMRECIATTQNVLKGTFMTFGEGPRACLGRNFAKVEFVAFFSQLLRGCRLKLGPSVKPTEIERELRLLSGGSPVTLIPPHPVDIQLVPT